MDPIGIAEYVAFGHTGQSLTCYERVRKVPCGTVYSWRTRANGQLGVDLTTRRIHQRPEEAGPVADAVQDSVRVDMVADVEVGIFLSGGIDSTLLAVFARGEEPISADVHCLVSRYARRSMRAASLNTTHGNCGSTIGPYRLPPQAWFSGSIASSL